MSDIVGLLDIPIGFSQIKQGLVYRAIRRAPSNGGQLRPDADHIMQHGLDALLHDRYQGHLVRIYPRSEQLVDLRDFFQSRNLRLSFITSEHTYSLFARYQYNRTVSEESIHCHGVIVRLHTCQRDTAVQLILRYGQV